MWSLPQMLRLPPDGDLGRHALLSIGTVLALPHGIGCR